MKPIEIILRDGSKRYSNKIRFSEIGHDFIMIDSLEVIPISNIEEIKLQDVK